MPSLKSVKLGLRSPQALTKSSDGRTGEELLQIADAAAHARARVPTELREPLARIQRSAEEAARAWSGSNIGYQATVYYRGLSPKPADSEFSPE